MNTLKKTVLKIVPLLLIVAMLFSLAGCGKGGVKVTSVRVENDNFFNDTFIEWYENNQAISENSPTYQLCSSFYGTYHDFEHMFLLKYDSYFSMSCVLSVENKNSFPITVTGIRVTNNGYKDTHVSSAIGKCDEVEIAAGETKEVNFLFLGNGSLYTNEDYNNKIFPKMPMELVYTDAEGTRQTTTIKFKSVEVE